mgnify:CR=1 FL=1
MSENKHWFVFLHWLKNLQEQRQSRVRGVDSCVVLRRLAQILRSTNSIHDCDTNSERESPFEAQGARFAQTRELVR